MSGCMIWCVQDFNFSEESDRFMRTMFFCAVAALCAVFFSCNNKSLTTAPTVMYVMRHIPAGTFKMGSLSPNVGGPGQSADETQHSVSLDSFHIDTTEVTQADYASLMTVNPSSQSGDSMLPVENVTWFDAVLYCNARSKKEHLDTVYSYTSVTGDPGAGCTNLANLADSMSKNGYRLPTEAEWEYACRAGDTADFYWGLTFPPLTHGDTAQFDSNAVWIHDSPLGANSAVATKKPNKFGLYDMSGNVDEWCNDWYLSTYYQMSPADNPTGPTSPTGARVYRGGSSSDLGLSVTDLRSGFRGQLSPSSSSKSIGFRCVRRP